MTEGGGAERNDGANDDDDDNDDDFALLSWLDVSVGPRNAAGDVELKTLTARWRENPWQQQPRRSHGHLISFGAS